jgi:hypothetical protein
MAVAAPAWVIMKAFGTAPTSASGLGMTAPSGTAECVSSSASSPAGATANALYLISSLARCATQIQPSGSADPEVAGTQPALNQRCGCLLRSADLRLVAGYGHSVEVAEAEADAVADRPPKAVGCYAGQVDRFGSLPCAAIHSSEDEQIIDKAPEPAVAGEQVGDQRLARGRTPVSPRPR